MWDRNATIACGLASGRLWLNYPRRRWAVCTTHESNQSRWRQHWTDTRSRTGATAATRSPTTTTTISTTATTVLQLQV